MGDTTTPVLGLVKPEVGASRSTWGTKWNANADVLDNHSNSLQSQLTLLESQVATLQTQMVAIYGAGVPIGGVVAWPVGTGAPGNFLACVGGMKQITDYQLLFNVIRTNYGGDGVTTFGIPDLRGCVLAGYDHGSGRLGGLVGPDVPNVIGGAAFIGLNESHMPPHNHGGTTANAGTHNHTYTTYSLPGGAGFAVGSGAQFVSGIDGTSNNGDHNHDLNIDFSGGGVGHPNVQTTALVEWLIRAA